MLKVNVGLSRKIGEAGYSSRGGAVHLEVELESGLTAEPARLQERLRQLFGLARSALSEELQPTATAACATPMSVPVPDAPSPLASTSHHGGKLATPAQVKAIYALARCKAVSARDFTDHRCGVFRPEELTLRQASQLIDELKALPEPIPTAYGETVQEPF